MIVFFTTFRGELFTSSPCPLPAKREKGVRKKTGGFKVSRKAGDLGRCKIDSI